jgi:hypothetical protein
MRSLGARALFSIAMTVMLVLPRLALPKPRPSTATLALRALRSGRPARLGATRDCDHGLLGRWNLRVLVTAFAVCAVACASTSEAADFACPSGDVGCLIAAIESSNANGEVNTIALEAGNYTTVDPHNIAPDGFNALPSVTSTLTIRGATDGATSIRALGCRPAGCRAFHVGEGGTLVLERLIITGSYDGSGVVILNRGTITISHSTLTGGQSQVTGIGGGLFNSNGTVFLLNSTVANNVAAFGGGGLANQGGTVVSINSTVTGNQSGGSPLRLGGGGLLNMNGGTMLLLNSTVTNNQAGDGGGGIMNREGTVTLQNTLLADNVFAATPDCVGHITSLGTNIVGDPTGCTIALLPTDGTGYAGLAGFFDDGSPGNGHVSLLPDGPAIDAANDTVCPRFDQLGRSRAGVCDIGASEFQALAVSSSSVPAGGTLTVTWGGIAALTSTDWIGLFAPGAANTSYLEWIYVNCSRVADAPRASGSCSFTVPGAVAPGSYHLRLLANDGFTGLLATSDTFIVTAP